MKPFVKYFNFVIFLTLSVLFVLTAPYEKLTTDLVSLLPQNEETKLLKIYEKFESSREVLATVKGENLKEIKALEKRVLKNDFIKLKKSFFENSEFRKYIKEYRFYLQDFDDKNMVFVGKKLKNAYQSLVSNSYYSVVDKNDPLSLFSRQNISTPLVFKNGHAYLKDYGYMSVFTFKEGTEFQKVYDVFQKEMKGDTKIFSPAFYFVENSKAIKSQVNLLVFIAIGILLLLYIVILKNIPLLINAVLTFLSASMVSLMIVTFFWSEVSIFVTVFGMAVSTVAIDYMFHHYFCGYYEKDKGFNRPVFFGFFSTFLAFACLSFVDFAFISQVSLYASVSLLFSYAVFAFLFPKVGFMRKKTYISFPSLGLIKNYKYFAVMLLVVVGYASLHIETDFNIRNLNYKNVKMKNTEDFFKNRLGGSGKTPFIIKEKTIDGLIQKSRDIKALCANAVIPLSSLISSKDFGKKQKKIKEVDFSRAREDILKKADEAGFRKGFFKEAYSDDLLYPKLPKYDLETVKNYGFDVLYDEGFYYGFGFILDSKKAEGVYLLDSAKLFQKLLNAVYDQLFICGILIFLCIVVILYKVAGRNFFKAFSYILFPMTTILFVMSFGSANILQIFMLFIIISLSIDYGIYMSEKDAVQGSKSAILFSLMSTFAGFGVLVFSSIGVLFYIGEVATVGLLAIFILLILGKDENRDFR